MWKTIIGIVVFKRVFEWVLRWIEQTFPGKLRYIILALLVLAILVILWDLWEFIKTKLVERGYLAKKPLLTEMGTATKDSQAKSGTPRAVILLALSMVAFELFCVALESALVFQLPTDYIKGGMRFLITCILAYFLFKGARWARWVTIIIGLLTFVISAMGFVSLPSSFSIFLRVWVLVIGLYCLAIALLLLFSKDIVGHFVSHHS